MMIRGLEKLVEAGLDLSDVEPHRSIGAWRVGERGNLHLAPSCTTLSATQRGAIASVRVDVLTEKSRACHVCFDLARTSSFFRSCAEVVSSAAETERMLSAEDLPALRRAMGTVSAALAVPAAFQAAVLVKMRAKRVELVSELGPHALDDAFTEVLLRGRVANDFLVPAVAGIASPGSGCTDREDPRRYVADAWRVSMITEVQPGSSSWWTSRPASVAPIDALTSAYEDYVAGVAHQDLPDDLEIDPVVLAREGAKPALRDGLRNWCDDRAQDTLDALEDLLARLLKERDSLVLVRGQRPEVTNLAEVVLASGVSSAPTSHSPQGWTLLRAPRAVAELLEKQGFATTTHSGELDLARTLETFLSLHALAGAGDLDRTAADLERAAALEA
jgi:hypothetical protein